MGELFGSLSRAFKFRPTCEPIIKFETIMIASPSLAQRKRSRKVGVDVQLQLEAGHSHLLDSEKESIKVGSDDLHMLVKGVAVGAGASSAF